MEDRGLPIMLLRERVLSLFALTMALVAVAAAMHAPAAHAKAKPARTLSDAVAFLNQTAGC